jgi:hypothetical protein
MAALENRGVIEEVEPKRSAHRFVTVSLNHPKLICRKESESTQLRGGSSTKLRRRIPWGRFRWPN